MKMRIPLRIIVVARISKLCANKQIDHIELTIQDVDPSCF